MPYLTDILPEPGDAEFDPLSDISEMIENTQPGGGDSFSLEAGEATYVYRFDWLKARSFIRWFLGFSYADSGPPYRLRRENPQRHPRFPWLTAQTIHLSSVAPKSNPFDGVPARAPNYPAVFVEGSGEITKAALYHETWATIRFVAQPWSFRSDDETPSHTDEVFRNCYFDPEPSVEMLSAEGPLAQLSWTETGLGGGAAGHPSVDTPIPTAMGTLVPKCAHVLNWMHVPQEYLSESRLAFRPRQILRSAGAVNATTFATEWQPGTLLALAPKFQRFRWPISTADGRYPFFGWNVRLPLVEFEPRPRGSILASKADAALDTARTNLVAARTGGTPAEIAAAEAAQTNALGNAALQPDGYRLLPWAPNLRYYPAKRADRTTYLYREADLNRMFLHILDN